MMNIFTFSFCGAKLGYALHIDYRNPSLGLATKARAYKGASQD
jgi:hypothetical protein